MRHADAEGMSERFSSYIGSQRAVAHVAGTETSEQAIEDFEAEMVRLERVVRALGALLRDDGVDEAALQDRTLELVRRRVDETDDTDQSS